MRFDELGLDAELLRAVADEGYTEPTPVQVQAIPVILEGKDVSAGAQTGTGKTAGFTLPMLQRLKRYANTSVSPARHPVRALILVPTRELAAQVFESVRTYGRYLPLRSSVVYGGVNIDPQIAELRAGVEVLVATPGRLLDHMHQRTVGLGQVEILVLDEADRMLDMGFLPDIKRIIAALPDTRQNLLFSATFSDEIKRLAAQILRSPVHFQVAPRNAVNEMVTHSAYRVDERRKFELLCRLVKAKDMHQVLVFLSTRLSANRIARMLEKAGFPCAAMHSDRTQMERTQALADFKAGKIQLLVATDIAARGLDVEDLPYVINYELPPNADDYIHRIGRTGRAGQPGEAISLVSADEQELLDAIQKLLKKPIPLSLLSELGDLPEFKAPADAELVSAAPRGLARRSPLPAVDPGPVTAAQATERHSGEPVLAALPPALFGSPMRAAGVAPAPNSPLSQARPAKRREIAALFLPPVAERHEH